MQSAAALWRCLWYAEFSKSAQFKLCTDARASGRNLRLASLRCECSPGYYQQMEIGKFVQFLSPGACIHGLRERGSEAWTLPFWVAMGVSGGGGGV